MPQQQPGGGASPAEAVPIYVPKEDTDVQLGPRWFEVEGEEPPARSETRRSRPPQYRIPAWLEQAAAAEQRRSASAEPVLTAPATPARAPGARRLALWCYLLALLIILVGVGMGVLGRLGRGSVQ